MNHQLQSWWGWMALQFWSKRSFAPNTKIGKANSRAFRLGNTPISFLRSAGLPLELRKLLDGGDIRFTVEWHPMQLASGGKPEKSGFLSSTHLDNRTPVTLLGEALYYETAWR
jgi:hypothetical protein